MDSELRNSYQHDSTKLISPPAYVCTIPTDCQALVASSCGEWCMYMAVEIMEHHKSLTAVLNEFSETDQKHNEVKLTQHYRE